MHTGTSVIDGRPVEEPWQATEKGFLDRENTHTHTRCVVINVLRRRNSRSDHEEHSS